MVTEHEKQRISEAKASEEYLKLLAHVGRRAAGDILTYMEVEQETGVDMQQRVNREKLRKAILRNGLEYSVIPSVGYQLAAANMAMGVLSSKLVRVDNAVRRADRAQRTIQTQFYEELPPEEQRAVLMLGSVFGAIRVAAENGKKLYGPERHVLVNASAVVIPSP